jgi:hypothetical protein
MSRNLYTIAAVVPQVSERIAGLVTSHEHVVAGEDALREAVAEPRPLVAFYRVLLDGWNQTHCVYREQLNSCGVVGSRMADDLDATGVFIGRCADVSDVQWTGLKVDESHLGACAVDALREALTNACEFAQGAKCDVVVLWRCLFGSFGDGEFGGGA